jgi:putative peptidoglycan lipid II flippase
MGLLRAAATVGSYTLVSRVLGFARDILMAATIGAGPVADAFFVALRLPNLFRSLFAEGAFSAAFVPLFAGANAESGEGQARLFAEDALSLLLSALVGFVVLGEIFMPAVMRVMAPGFAAVPSKFALVVELGRITFPYLLFIALVALAGGVLNSLDRFASAAATPILLNLFLIGALLAIRRFGFVGGRFLALAVTAAGLAQFLWLYSCCAQAGFALRLPRPRLGPEVRRTLKLMAPAVFGAGVTQLNLVISTALASLLPTGSVSYLYYADRLNQLPLGVVGVAVGTAILPAMSRQIRLGDTDGVLATQNRALELALFLTLPAALALALLSRPILSTLFERGAFGPAAATATAAALSAYAGGLPAFVLIRVLTPGFFARADTKTPVRIAIAAMLVNLTLTLVLMRFLAHVGIALATSVAGWVNALTLLTLLGRRGHFRLDQRARKNLPRIAASALGMALVLVLLQAALASALEGRDVVRLAALAGLVAAGLAAFAALALLLGVANPREILRRLFREPA